MDLTSTVFPSFTTHRRKKKIKKRKKKPGDQKAVWSLLSHFRADSKSWFFFYSWLFKPNKWTWRLDKRERDSHNSIWRGSKPTVAKAERWADCIHELIIITSLPHSGLQSGPMNVQKFWIRANGSGVVLYRTAQVPGKTVTKSRSRATSKPLLQNQRWLLRDRTV